MSDRPINLLFAPDSRAPLDLLFGDQSTDPTGPTIRIWAGAQWEERPIYRWNGVTFEPAIVRRWNGSVWV